MSKKTKLLPKLADKKGKLEGMRRSHHNGKGRQERRKNQSKGIKKNSIWIAQTRNTLQQQLEREKLKINHIKIFDKRKMGQFKDRRDWQARKKLKVQ